jgi:pseudoazurin
MALGLGLSAAASARTVDVHMKSAGAGGMMVFEPAMVEIARGDIVHFIPADPSHNAETIPGMLPDGAAAIAGAMGKDVSVTFTQPGVYGIRCKPHYTMGMVALVVVGKAPANLASAKAAKLPPLAAKRMAALLATMN